MDEKTDTRDALLYARISQTDENVPKVEYQLADLRKLAASRGYRYAGTYVDDGLSAVKADNRPDFDRLLAELPNHRGAVILATEDARLARNNAEKQALTFACIQAGVTWETMRDGATDPSTAAGEFMSVIRGAVDTLESKRKAERQRAANAHRRANGKPQPGQRPFGWAIVGSKPIRHEPILREQALILWGIEMVLYQRMKPWGVVRVWNRTGIKTGRGNDWTTTSVVSVLRRWRNAGWTEHKDEPIAQGEWEPICSRDQLEKVREILDTPVREPGWRKAEVLCSGLALCQCGERLLSTGNRDGRSYRCSSIMKPGAKEGQHVSIRVAQLDALVRKAVIDSYFWTPNGTDAADTEAHTLSELQREVAKLRDQQSALLELHLDGTVTKAVFAKKNAALVSRERETEQRITELASANAHARMLTETRRLLFASRKMPLADAVAAKRELAEVFDGLTMEDRRRLVAASATVVVRSGRGAARVSITGDGLPADADC